MPIENHPTDPDKLVAREREKVAKWMMDNYYATGNGDTIEDLLAELQWQIRERIDTLTNMYEQASRQRDELMDLQRSQLAAIRGMIQ